VSLPRTGHDSPRDGTVTFDQFNIPSCPVSGVHFKPTQDYEESTIEEKATDSLG